MRALPLTLAILCLAAGLAQAQYLEAVIPVGTGPVDVLWNPASNKVYTADLYGASVTVIDGATNQVLATVPVAESPLALCWNSVGNKVYATSADPDWLNVIDGAGDTLIKKVRMRGGPTRMAFSVTANKLYVVCYDDQAIRVYDGSSETLVDEVSLGATSYQLLWHPATNRVFCAASCDGSLDTVFVLDCTSDTIVKRVPVGDQPYVMCWNPVDEMIYVGTRYAIQAIPASGDSVVASIDGWSRDLCAAPFPNKLYASGRPPGLDAIDCDTHTVIDSIAAPSGPMICDTIRGKVYMAADNADIVSVADAKSDTLLLFIPLPPGANYSMAWNGADSRVYIADGRENAVYVIRDTTTGIAEEAAGAEMGQRQTATVVRGVLHLEAPSRKPQAASWLLDIGGRKVMELQSGANDVSRITPGVYFVREAQAQAQARTKVIVQR